MGSADSHTVCHLTSPCKVRITILVTWEDIIHPTKVNKAKESTVAVDTRISSEITTEAVDTETEVIEATEEETEEIEAEEMIEMTEVTEIEMIEETAEVIEAAKEEVIEEETEVKEVIEVIAEAIEEVIEEILVGVINMTPIREREWTTSKEIRDLIVDLLAVEAEALREGIEKVASETITSIRIEKVETGMATKEETLINHMTEKVVMTPLEIVEAQSLVTGNA